LKYFRIFVFFPKREIYPRANGGILPLLGSFARIVLFPFRILTAKTFIAPEQGDGTALYKPGKLNRGGAPAADPLDRVAENTLIFSGNL
jgi:hypothetical protein